MKAIWVSDPGNFRYSWVANECTKHQNAMIFTFSKWSEYLMEAFLLRYGVTHVPTKRFTNFFLDLMNMPVVTVNQLITRIRHKRHIFGNMLRNDAERRDMITMYLNRQRFMMPDMAAYLDTFDVPDGRKQYYISFERLYNQYIGITPLTGMARAIETGVTFKKDTIFVLGAEDLYPLAVEAIRRVFRAKQLYFVGDEEKAVQYVRLWKPIQDGKLTIDETIDLSSSVSMPKHLHDLCTQITTCLKIPHQFKSSNADGVFHATDNEAELLERINNRDYDLAVICYHDVIIGNYIEGLLNQNGIPFWTAAYKGTIPEPLMNFCSVMHALEVGNRLVSRSQIYSALNALDPYLTSRFGGIVKLKEHFSPPQIPAQTLRHMGLFKILFQKWTEARDFTVLRDVYRPKLVWAKMRTKHPDWRNPRVVCCHVREAKNLRPDITFYLLSYWNGVPTFSEWMLRWLYCMLPVTLREFWVLPIGEKLGRG